MNAWKALVVAGIAAVVAGGGWWLFSAPDETANRTEEVSCYMNGTTCDLAERAVAGPIAVAVIGAFLVLVGVILRGQAVTARSHTDTVNV